MSSSAAGVEQPAVRSGETARRQADSRDAPNCGAVRNRHEHLAGFLADTGMGNRGVTELLDSCQYRHLGAASQGVPLPDRTRSDMETTFGTDLGGVRIHTNPAAAASAAVLRAGAYAVGEDIYLGHSIFQLDSGAARYLLAHELAHVLQQRQGGSVEPSTPGPHEEHAHAAAARAEAGDRQVTVGGGTWVGIARISDDEVDQMSSHSSSSKQSGHQRARSPLNSYVDLLNGFSELAAAAVNRGGAGLDTVRLGPDLSPAHRRLLFAVRKVLIQAQENSQDARSNAAEAWPALAAQLLAAVSEARGLNLPGDALASTVDAVALVGRKYVHARSKKDDPETATAADYVEAVKGVRDLLDAFSRMSVSPDSDLVTEQVSDRSDVSVASSVVSLNRKQRAVLSEVKFGHLIRRHAVLLESLRKALISARTETPGSAYRAVAAWGAIQGDLQHVLLTAIDYADFDLDSLFAEFSSTGEALARHYEAVHRNNVRVALTKRRPQDPAVVEKSMPRAFAAGARQARNEEDFTYALNLLEEHLQPAPDNPDQRILTGGSTVIRLRADQVVALRAAAAAALKKYMADITTVMVDAWQTYDSIKRGNSSFKLHVLGGWGGASDPGDQEEVKNSVIRVRDTIVYPLVDQGKYSSALKMITAQRGVVAQHAQEVGEYDADLDTGYNRFSKAMGGVQVALLALVPVAGEAALASGAGTLAVGTTAVASGAGGAAVAETGRELGAGEKVDPGKIGGAAYKGAVIGSSALTGAATRGLTKVYGAGLEGTALVGAETAASATIGGIHSKLSGGDALQGTAGAAFGHLGGSAVGGLTKSLAPGIRATANLLSQSGVGAGTSLVTGQDVLTGVIGSAVGGIAGKTVKPPTDNAVPPTQAAPSHDGGDTGPAGGAIGPSPAPQKMNDGDALPFGPPQRPTVPTDPALAAPTKPQLKLATFSQSTEQQIRALMDEHPTLTRANAELAVQGPPGSVATLSGKGGTLTAPPGTANLQKAQDVEFANPTARGRSVNLRREVKTWEGNQGKFNDAISDAADQLTARGSDWQTQAARAGGEVLIQVPEGTDARSRVQRFKGSILSSPQGVEKFGRYRSITVTIVDPSGRVLLSEPLEFKPSALEPTSPAPTSTSDGDGS